jgi:hypothetical protein
LALLHQHHKLLFSDMTFSYVNFLFMILVFFTSDVEAEAEVPEAVDLWWKRKRLKICRFRLRSVSKLLFKFWQMLAD